MIKVDKGNVEVVGKSTEVFAELMLVCSELKQKSPEKLWDTFADYFVEQLTDLRIYESARETAVCKDVMNLTIGLAYVLREVSKHHGDKREKILKLAFELADDMLKHGDVAVLNRADDLLKMGGDG